MPAPHTVNDWTASHVVRRTAQADSNRNTANVRSALARAPGSSERRTAMTPGQRSQHCERPAGVWRGAQSPE